MKIGDEAPEDFIAGQWSDIEDMVHEWARDVKYFLNNPDLWAELRSEQNILSGSAYETMSNAPFGADEQVRIAEQLREIRSYLAERCSLSDEQTAEIEARLHHLEEATHRIGRKDWLLMFYGVILTLIVTALVPPDVVQHVIGMVIDGLGDFFGFGGPPPSLPPVA